MTSDGTREKKGRAFYGWYALTRAMLASSVTGGALINTFGVFLPVISAEFEWSRATVSLALSIAIMAFGLPSPFFGFLVNKFGARFCIILGNSLAALAIAGLFLVQETWHYYLLYILFGLGGGLGGYIACTTVANNWFVKRRSLAMGILTASTGIGGLIYPPVVTALIPAIGWRESWLVLAGVVIVLAIVVGGVVLIKNRPEDMGQVPDGLPSNFYAKTEELVSGPGNEPASWRSTQIFKMPTTWLIAVFVFANALALGAMIAHQVAYIEDIGFNPMTAATTLSFLAVFSVIGSIAFGTLSLKLNMRYLASAGFLFQIIALLILLTTRNLGLIYLYAAFMGLGAGALFTAMPTFIGAYYPRKHYAQVTGVILPFHMVAQAVSATVVGAIYDITSKYTLAFSILGVWALVGLICAFLARPPKQ